MSKTHLYVQNTFVCHILRSQSHFYVQRHVCMTLSKRYLHSSDVSVYTSYYSACACANSSRKPAVMSSGSNGISRARELLARAVEFLDAGNSPSESLPGERISARSSSVEGRPAPGRLPASSSARTPWSARSFSSRTGSRERSALAERSLLFNFGGKKRPSSSGEANRKKKRLVLWTHEFVCLSDTDQDRTPTASERARLLAAGLL